MNTMNPWEVKQIYLKFINNDSLSSSSLCNSLEADTGSMVMAHHWFGQEGGERQCCKAQICLQTQAMCPDKEWVCVTKKPELFIALLVWEK